MLWLLLRLPAFLQACFHHHRGRDARLPWRSSLGRGAISPDEFTGVSAKTVRQQYIRLSCTKE